MLKRLLFIVGLVIAAGCESPADRVDRMQAEVVSAEARVRRLEGELQDHLNSIGVIYFSQVPPSHSGWRRGSELLNSIQEAQDRLRQLQLEYDELTSGEPLTDER